MHLTRQMKISLELLDHSLVTQDAHKTLADTLEFLNGYVKGRYLEGVPDGAEGEERQGGTSQNLLM